MKIQIDKQYMSHESGTKFYQVLRVKVSGPGAPLAGTGMNSYCTVTNWGKQTGPTGQRRIVAGGESQIKGGDSYGSTIAAKRKRGYNDGIAWGTTNVLKNAPALKTYLIEELGEVASTEVLGHLRLLTESAVEPTPDAEDSSARKSAREASAPEEPPEAASMDGWGEF